MFDDHHLKAQPANLQPLTPLGLLDWALEVHGKRTAVAWRDDIWSYGEFGDIVARMAGWLADQGVQKGDVVSVILNNRPELLAAHFAVPALGAVLNTINTRLANEEIIHILNHAESRLLIGEHATRTDIDGCPTPFHVLCSYPGANDGLDFFAGPTGEIDLLSEIEDEYQPIALNYTSGTTGKPKGVVYTHRGAFLNAISNANFLGFDPDTRYLWTLPMFHCNGWTHTWAVTGAGGMHVCLDKPDPGLIIKEFKRRPVSHMCCAPVVLYMLQKDMDEPSKTRVKIGTGGAAPTPTLLAGLEALGFDLVHLYGLTESYGPATINDAGPDGPSDLAERADLLARQGWRHKTSGGARVVDSNGNDVHADGKMMGEIVLRGNTVMAGYYRDPQATAKAFAGGVFHTGDLAVMHPDGQIEIRDRSKDIIISGGENISSLEVETVLHRHPDILLAAVVAAPHPKWGETPWAFVETRDGRVLDTAALDDFCREHLAGYKQPRRYVAGELPKTATGKIQKFVLREKATEMAANDPD